MPQKLRFESRRWSAFARFAGFGETDFAYGTLAGE